jgi:hypothetical protein
MEMMKDIRQLEQMRDQVSRDPGRPSTPSPKKEPANEPDHRLHDTARRAGVGGSASPARAQSSTQQDRAPHEREALERWQRLTPQEQNELRERYQRWKNLPPAEKDDLNRKMESWRKLPEDEKTTIRRNFERWRDLPADQRERLQERWQRWRDLPPERREDLRRRMEKFRDLSSAEKQRLGEQSRER